MSRQLYAHVAQQTGKIVAVNSKPEAAEGRITIALPHDLALKLIGGQENPHFWVAQLRDDGYVLEKIEPDLTPPKRVDLLPIAEVAIRQLRDGQSTRLNNGVVILVDRETDTLELCYDGEYVKTLKQPLKIYATREGDPSYLKCAISLDVNILNEIMHSNELDCWPNPLRVKLANGTSDLSLFAPTATTVLAFEKLHA